MKISILLFSAIIYFSSGLIMAESAIYTWTDKDGNAHFSDHELPGAHKVGIKASNIVSEDNHEKNSVEDNTSTIASTNSEVKKNITYQVNFTSPKNDQAIRANNGNFPVNVVITPQQKKQHQLQLYIDGQKYGNAQLSTTILAEKVDRGAHQIQVFLLDEKNNMLAKTKIITVYIQKVSKINSRSIVPVMTKISVN
jgi:hypothetical protein